MSFEPSLELSLYADFFRKLKEPFKEHASVTVEERGGFYFIEVKPYWTDELWIRANKAYRITIPNNKKDLTSKVMFQLVSFTMVVDSFIDTYEDEIPGSMALQSQLMAASNIIEAAWEEMNAPKEEEKKAEEAKQKEESKTVAEESESKPEEAEQKEEPKPIVEETESKAEEPKTPEKTSEEPADKQQGFLAKTFNWFVSLVVKNSTN